MVSIRGAITVNEDKRDEILESTRILLTSMIEKNRLQIEDIVSIIFTCTKDIESVYPAVAAREMGIDRAGLMCLNEMYVKGSLEKCIRVLIHANMNINQKDVKHVYMRGAEILRPDLCSGN